jgi:hypothetical protein
MDCLPRCSIIRRPVDMTAQHLAHLMRKTLNVIQGVTEGADIATTSLERSVP